jgi:CRP/FNR family transcriptional regulator, cyclic AMP receptor protein
MARSYVVDIHRMMDEGNIPLFRRLSAAAQSALKRAHNVPPVTIAPMIRRPEYTRIRAALAASAHFQPLPAIDLDRLASIGRLQALAHGARPARGGVNDDSLWVILSGAMRVSSAAPGVKEYVYAVLGPGSFFGLSTAVRRAPLTIEARAFGKTDLASFSAARLGELLEDRPQLWRHVSTMLSRRLRLALLVLRDNSVAPLPERIARRVLAHAMSSDLRARAEVKVRMTQNDLALMLGASRSKTNAALKVLEGRGLLDAGYRGITIRDVPGLRQFAGVEVQAF